MANKLIKNKQCTIVFYVDDLKISHRDEEVVINIIEELNKRFGDIMPLSVSRGKVHNYLNITFDYTTKVKLIITMYDYIDGIIKNADQIYKDGSGSATPASDHLYEIRDVDSEDYEPLSEDERKKYHTITAQCLYLSKRDRPDLQQLIAFNCTRVNNPTKDDQKKEIRTIKY